MVDRFGWEETYRNGGPESTPWESGKPSKYLVEIVKNGDIPGNKVLDTCSGLGTQSIFLAQNGYDVHGIEISETAVTKAKENAKKAGVEVDFVKGNVQNLPFDENYFDFIYDRGCLHHQYDKEMKKYLSEVNRVLKPKGRMFLIAFTSRFTTDGLISLFANDFEVLEHMIFQEKAADNVFRQFHALFLEKK